MTLPGTRGVKQRDVITMSVAEVTDFLGGRHTMSVATIGPDDRIHLVAMWYAVLQDGTLALETKAKSQKAANLRRDPRCTCLVEDGAAYDELRGVELVCRAEVVDDPAALWPIGVSVVDRYIGPYTPDLDPLVATMLTKRVGVLLHVEKTVSWDHRKLPR